jgi:predicted membrane chloride channel (bestrophin family)
MRILVILVALVGSLALLDPLGFRISLFLFLLFLPFALGERTWWVTLIFAAAGSFGVFHVFYYGLKVPLPVGVFGI